MRQGVAIACPTGMPGQIDNRPNGALCPLFGALWWEEWLVRGLADRTAAGIARPGVVLRIIWRDNG